MPNFNCGVYAIILPSGGQYIGSSVNISGRWHRHARELKHGRHSNSHLQRAYNKHGRSVIFTKLIICEQQDLLLYEQRAIDILQPRYNLSPTAGSVAGIKHDPKVYESRIEKHRLYRHTPEIRKLLSDMKRGTRQSPEARAKQSISIRMAHSRPEVKAKVVSAARRHAADKNIREKISKSLLGRKKPPRTPEHREKLAAKKRGSKASEETRAKMRNSQRERLAEREQSGGISPETRAAMSKAQKARYAIQPSTLKGQKRPPFSPEWRANISKSHQGKIQSKVTKLKRVESLRRTLAIKKKAKQIQDDPIQHLR